MVLQGKRKIIISVKGVTDEKGYEGYEEMAPFGADVNVTIFEEGEEVAYNDLVMTRPRSCNSSII